MAFFKILRFGKRRRDRRVRTTIRTNCRARRSSSCRCWCSWRSSPSSPPSSTGRFRTAFATNPGLNGLILGVLVVGILLCLPADRPAVPRGALGQLLPRRLRSHRTGAACADEGAAVALLDDGASRPARCARCSIRSPPASTKARDISRYLTGLLVFLGLLGTFWGLLGDHRLDRRHDPVARPRHGRHGDVLDALKAGLAAPLAGMGTAFSSSLFGLSGSLVVGFLDLQAGRAQTRFYTELENWLSSVTDLSSDIVVAEPAEGRTVRRDPLAVGAAAHAAGKRRLQPARRHRHGQSRRRHLRAGQEHAQRAADHARLGRGAVGGAEGDAQHAGQDRRRAEEAGRCS